MAECTSIESLLNTLINKVNALSAPNNNDYVTRTEFNAEVSRLKSRQDSLDGLLQSLRAYVDTLAALVSNLSGLVNSLKGVTDELRNALAQLLALLLQKIAELLGLINNGNLEARISALEGRVNQLEQEYMSGINSVKGAALAAISEGRTFSIQAIGQEKEFAIKEIEQKLAIAFFVGTGAIVLAQTTAIATIGATGATAATLLTGTASAATAAIGSASTAIATTASQGATTIAVEGTKATAALSAAATTATAAIATETATATAAIGTATTVATTAITTQSAAATVATNLLRIAAVAVINELLNRAIDKILNTEPKTVTIREPYPVTTIERVNIPQPFQVTQTNTITKVEVIEKPFPIVQRDTITNVQIVEVPKPYPVTQIERVVIPQVITQTNTQIERVSVPQLVTQTNTVTKIQTVTVPQIVVQTNTKTEVKTVDKQIVVTNTRPMTCQELKQCEETATATIKTFKECKDGKPVFESKTITVPKADKASIESISNKLADIEAQKCDESEAIALIPEWWQTRTGQRPQLVVRFQNINSDGSIGKSAWSLAIPHYIRDKNYKPLFPNYRRGDIQGILVLSDNSKVIINCINITEAKRVLAVIKQFIDPKYLNDSYEKYGERKGTAFNQVNVKAVSAKYFPDGQKNTTAEWSIRLG